MQNRTEPRVIPDRKRYVELDAGDHGILDIKLPSEARQLEIMQFLARNKTATDPGSSKLAMSLDLVCVVVGICWFHRDLDLETSAPADGASDEELLVFGRAIGEELYEAEWSVLDDLAEPFGTLVKLMAAPLLPTPAEVEETAGFSEPEKATPAS